MNGITLELILERRNLSLALDRVERNDGAPGVDGMRTEYLNYRCKNPMDAGCPSGSTSSRRFPGGLIFGSSEISGQVMPKGR